jgi:hypothetical protein
MILGKHIGSIRIIWTVFGIYDIPTQLWVSRDLDKQGNSLIIDFSATAVTAGPLRNLRGSGWVQVAKSPSSFATDVAWSG